MPPSPVCGRVLHALAAMLLFTATAVMSSAATPAVVAAHELDGVPDRVVYRAPEVPPAWQDENKPAEATLTLVIDLDGSVHAIESVRAPAAELEQAAREAVQQWRFEPGYAQGLPVRYRVEVTVPFRVEGMGLKLDSRPTGDASVEVLEPTVEYAVAPLYPAALAATPRDGVARVNVLIDAIGNPSDPVVEYATHPAFAEAAREAVLGWEFSPAERDGGLVSARTQVIVRFNREDAAKSDAQRRLEAQIAHAASYDVAPEVVKQVPLVFPYDELLQGKRATVSLNVMISPEGQVVEIVPEPGAGGDFVMAAAACIACWRFNPATKADQPVYARMKWQLVFTEQSSELQFDEVTHELISALREGTFRTVPPRELDRPIAFKERVIPEWIPGQGREPGDALIEVIIDRNGRPQLPRVLSAPSPATGYAAATAVLRWRFEPPRSQNQPVDVRVKIPFHITSEAESAKAPSGG